MDEKYKTIICKGAEEKRNILYKNRLTIYLHLKARVCHVPAYNG
jgi:hypothetical protein